MGTEGIELSVVPENWVSVWPLLSVLLMPKARSL